MSQTGGNEIEIKLRVDDLEATRGRIEKLAGEPSKPRVFESNTVLDTADLELKGRGELIRLRTVGDDRVLTFKGRDTEKGKHKSREELEVHVSDADRLQQIFGRLGYTPSFRYEKYRTEYEYQDGTITVDETPIGQFLELEGAPAWIDATAAALGFREQDYLTASYADLYRTYCEEHGQPVRHMIFASHEDVT